MLDAEGLIPYLYTFNASPASQQLIALGAAAGKDAGWNPFNVLHTAVPLRSRTCIIDLLCGCMISPEGRVTRAITASGGSRHWTTYCKLLQRRQPAHRAACPQHCCGW